MDNNNGYLSYLTIFFIIVFKGDSSPLSEPRLLPSNDPHHYAYVFEILTAHVKMGTAPAVEIAMRMRDSAPLHMRLTLGWCFHN